MNYTSDFVLSFKCGLQEFLAESLETELPVALLIRQCFFFDTGEPEQKPR